jgi:hypothetical protein
MVSDATAICREMRSLATAPSSPACELHARREVHGRAAPRTDCSCSDLTAEPRLCTDSDANPAGSVQRAPTGDLAVQADRATATGSQVGRYSPDPSLHFHADLWQQKPSPATGIAWKPAHAAGIVQDRQPELDHKQFADLDEGSGAAHEGGSSPVKIITRHPRPESQPKPSVRRLTLAQLRRQRARAYDGQGRGPPAPPSHPLRHPA